MPRSESSSPLTCGCPYCGAWRKERGLERVPVEQMPEERVLPLEATTFVPRVRDERLGWVDEAEEGG